MGMLGIDVDKVMAPFLAAMNQMNNKLDRVIELLEEVSEKLDN